MSQTNKPIILTIAANDSAGIAGIAMDIKTQASFGIHSMVAITANTAQNDFEVISVNAVDVIALKAQLEAVKGLPIAVVKVGMVCNIEQARAIAQFINATRLPLILDPVLSSSSGYEFFKAKDIAFYVDILLPLCELVTPNLHEASLLTNLSTSSEAEIELAAYSMMLLGAKNVLIKGGHGDDEICQDYFASEKQSFWLTSPKSLKRNTRGTGCALASTIASCLALGYSIADAVVIGKMAINQGIRNSYPVGDGKGPVAVEHFPDSSRDLPWLSTTSNVDLQRQKFPDCGETRLGLYPIVERAVWLKRLLPLGIKTIQLRIKDLRDDALEMEIVQAIEIARQYQCRLFINDHWQLAIKHQAYGVHLGQDDLEAADLEAIHTAGLRLGVSSHCHHEVARAITCQPSYIAVGPVFHTTSKKMPWVPQGVAGLSYWQKVLEFPLVAIGGINGERLDSILTTGVNGIALITAITNADDPIEAAQDLLAKMTKG